MGVPEHGIMETFLPWPLLFRGVPVKGEGVRTKDTYIDRRTILWPGLTARTHATCPYNWSWCP